VGVNFGASSSASLSLAAPLSHSRRVARFIVGVERKFIINQYLKKRRGRSVVSIPSRLQAVVDYLYHLISVGCWFTSVDVV
jgi:hypothetical protein